MIYLLITADDFGKNPDINRAVDIAIEEGILTSASLMVVGDKWEEAVEIAKKKDIDVGLHVSLTEGNSILLNKKINISPALFGLSAQFCKETISWITREISLQFSRFTLTGLPFSHVDSHHHIHIHPKISKILIRNCQTYKIKSLRIPYEPWKISWPICNRHRLRNICYVVTFSYLCKPLTKKTQSAGLVSTDGVFGIYRTGEITEEWFLLLLDRLHRMRGIFEVYLHPEDKKGVPGYEELKTVTSQKVRNKIRDMDINLIGFSDLPYIIHA